ncbi:MAG: ATP-binding cassette domain-containing protein [Steroidobacter sp.]
MIDNQPLIELSHCSLIFDGHAVLDDVSFVLRRGERWVLVGPNGSGKTMLLKMLRGDVWPTPTDGNASDAEQGSANGAGAGMRRSDRRYHFDAEVSDQPAGIKRRIAYVGPERQDKYVRYGWNLSVAEVVTTGLFDEDIPLTTPTRSERERVMRTLRRFGLRGLRMRRMLTLSYGQRRLVLVARAYASDARVLLLDEVFNGLDARTKEKLRRGLEQTRGGHDWVVTSHRPKELPVNVTHIARMERGRIIEMGPGRGAWGAGRNKKGEGLGARGSGQSKMASAAYRMGVVKKTFVTHFRSDLSPAPQAPRPFIVIRNATLFRDYRPVIRDLNWTVQRGEHWAVLGANGSGKSTLLSLIYGDLHPALGGQIERAGQSSGARIETWKHRVGWLSPELQADHFRATTIEEIVISGRYASVGLNEPPTRTDRVIARRWLKIFGLEQLRERGPRQVSYGQMRLALIARAMVNDPELLLLDEPCAGLDSEVRARVLALVEQLAHHGTQIMIAVHDPDDIAPSVSKVLRIGRGGRASPGSY